MSNAKHNVATRAIKEAFLTGEGIMIKPIEEFLRLLYGDDAPGHLAIWNKSDKKTCWVPARDLENAAKQIANTVVPGECTHQTALNDSTMGERAARMAGTSPATIPTMPNAILPIRGRTE